MSFQSPIFQISKTTNNVMNQLVVSLCLYWVCFDQPYVTHCTSTTHHARLGMWRWNSQGLSIGDTEVCVCVRARAQHQQKKRGITSQLEST